MGSRCCFSEGVVRVGDGNMFVCFFCELWCRSFFDFMLAAKVEDGDRADDNAVPEGAEAGQLERTDPVSGLDYQLCSIDVDGTLRWFDLRRPSSGSPASAATTSL